MLVGKITEALDRSECIVDFDFHKSDYSMAGIMDVLNWEKNPVVEYILCFSVV